MAATTISRESMTDGVTAWDVARIGSAIYDKIDALIGANITFGGTLSAEGFGSHVFSSGGTGTQRLQVRNTTSGTTMRASLDVGNNSTAELVRIVGLSSAHTASGYLQASGGIVEANGAGGLSIACTDASGVMRFYTGASVTERMRIDASGLVGVGVAASGALLHVGGSFSGSGTLSGLKNTASVTSSAGANLYGFQNAPTLVEASSGTHSIVAGALFDAPAVTVGAASVTIGANVYINGPTNASGATNYGLYVASGACGFPDGSSSSPTLVGISGGISSGVYWSNSGTRVNIATQSVQCAEFAGAPASEKTLTLPSAATGTGSFSGQAVIIGRNSSGGGAPGGVRIIDKGGTGYSIWPDSSGNWRSNTAAPTETSGDTIGTVIGTQTSTRATKRLIRRVKDTASSLALIAQTPLYRFNYRTQDRDTRFLGIMADESPEFVMHGGQSFNPVNAFGHTAAAIKALLARVEALEAARG